MHVAKVQSFTEHQPVTSLLHEASSWRLRPAQHQGQLPGASTAQLLLCLTGKRLEIERTEKCTCGKEFSLRSLPCFKYSDALYCSSLTFLASFSMPLFYSYRLKLLSLDMLLRWLPYPWLHWKHNIVFSFSLFMGQHFQWPCQFSLSFYLRIMTSASSMLVFMLWWAGHSRGKFFPVWKTRNAVGVQAASFSMPFPASKFKARDKPAERGIKALHL